MRKKISFVVLTQNGAAARQFCMSRSVLRWLLALAVGFAGAGAFVAIDYVQLKRAALHLEQREAELGVLLADRSDEVELQRRQISEFAGQINTLKEKLLALNQFEKKIRIMADIEKRPDAGHLFGIGGSIPKTMDPKAAFREERSSLIREMHAQTAQLEVGLVNQSDSFSALVTHLEKQQRLLAATPTIRPIDPAMESWVSSKFDWRISPFTNQREFHKGYDIASREGTPIYATAGGVVTFSGTKGLLGKTIIIDHGHGLTTVYGHCSRLLKTQGEKVGRWDTIALVGNSGSSTGPHLHYEVWVHGVPVNPEKYFLN
ncbi:MAG: M23 family metallopeptidase [Desulfobacterales bacterium]|nr:M23 family metallopeptidase [Desulfobacterales bacterium]